MRSDRNLMMVSALYLINSSIGARIAVQENLPGAFAGIRSGKHARDDFVVGFGTALSPSLWMMLIHACFMCMSLGAGRRRRIGVKGQTIDGMLFSIGMLGEPITYQVYRPRSFDPVKVAVVGGNILLPLLMLRFGRRAWHGSYG